MSQLTKKLRDDLSNAAATIHPSEGGWDDLVARLESIDRSQQEAITVLEPQPIRRTRTQLVLAAAAALVVIVGAAFALRALGSDRDPTDPARTTTTSVAETTVPEPEPSSIGPFEILEGGPVTIDLGTELAFELPPPQTGSGWRVTQVINGAAELVVGSPPERSEFLVLSRLGSWTDADESTRGDFQSLTPRDGAVLMPDGLGSIAANSIDRWIEANEFELLESTSLTIDGRMAERRTVVVTPSAGSGICVNTEPYGCRWYATQPASLAGPGTDPIDWLYAGRTVRFYLIDMGEFEPLLVRAESGQDDELRWLDEMLDPLVESMTLGEPGPADS